MSAIASAQPHLNNSFKYRKSVRSMQSSIKLVSFAVSICLALTGCGGDPLPDGQSPNPRPPSDDTPSAELEEIKTTIVNQIDNASLCKKVTDECDWSMLTFSPTDATSASLGKRVLILDEGMIAPSVTRYQTRVLAQYDFNAEGHLQVAAPEVNLPTELIPVFETIWEHADFISAGALQDIQSKYLEKFSILGMPGHGESIFTYIAETSPESQFVLVDYKYDKALKLTPSWCEQLTGEASAKESAFGYLESQYDQLLQDISQLVQVHHISFINASLGFAPGVARTLIEYYCTPEDYGPISDDIINDVVSIEHTFLRGLSELTNQSSGLGIRDDVILVQAGIASPVPLVEGDPQYPVDCDSSMTQRLRVADYDNFKADVPPEGSQEMDILSTSERNSLACTDLYLTLGFGTLPYPMREERERSFKGTLLGIGWAPHPFPPTPSFAAPVALSRLIHLEQQQAELLSAEALISLLTHQGRVKIQDPIQHEQFELFRLQDASIKSQ